MKLGEGVLAKLAKEGDRSSLRYVQAPFNPRSEANMAPFPRYALQLLTPASILANISGRQQIELEDIGEMSELFLDAKTSANVIGQNDTYIS